jgi:NAD(P)-dependent dehydrogenase (short-subunit alcohol dehydrogenase family)
LTDRETSDMRFSGKVAIVTGGASGIGKATVELMAREGGKVLLADVSSRGEQVAASMVSQGLQVAFQQIDVSQEEQVAAMVTAALERWGRLDIMIANAGIGGRGTADETSVSDWERVVGVNLTGVFLCAKYAVPAMRAVGGGAIVCTASVMGLVGTPGALPYTSTKGAVINMTRSMALDHAKDRIRVNTVCPGHLEDPTSVGGAAARATDSRDLLSRYPMGRLGLPEDVAKAIAFLASDDATFITGTSLVVDGGYTAQ